MATPTQPIDKLFMHLKHLDGQPFEMYSDLLHATFCHTEFTLRFEHIQGSPGAFPASTCHLVLAMDDLGIETQILQNDARRLATADYLLRSFVKAVKSHAHQNRGAQGSGSYQPLDLPPQILERNSVKMTRSDVRVAFDISLPGSHDNRILGNPAVVMLDRELNGIVHALKASFVPPVQWIRHCDVVEDMVTLQDKLHQYGLVAFVKNGAILPRESGISQAPLKKGAVSFLAPDDLAFEVDLPNAGRVKGLGIRPGVNVVIGGAYHGKSTLLDALCKGVYPHIPGDGRECVVVRKDAVFIATEQGRSVRGVNVSGFIGALPGQADTSTFNTDNASGSTSQAASIIEALQAGAGFLLIDEDSSATNFLIKDGTMRKLIPEDAITPLFDRVQEMYQQWGVSTLMVVGGSSEYLGVANHVMAMRDYRPVDMAEHLRRLNLPKPQPPGKPLQVEDHRRLTAQNFDPSYRSHRLGKTIATRIKPLRLREKVLEYGNQELDLSRLSALVDPSQVKAIGYALLLARLKFSEAGLSPSNLAGAIDEVIESKGLAALMLDGGREISLARPRKLELAAAINRIRDLEVDIDLLNS